MRGGQSVKLSLHVRSPRRHDPGLGQAVPLIVLDEVLWDLFPTASCLGGTPLNFAVHTSRSYKKLEYRSILISATDDLGVEARQRMRAVRRRVYPDLARLENEK